MQEKPLVSVICLCYNHEKFVLECLNSVKTGQTYQNIELIIVDDCSTDNSKYVIENWLTKYPEIIFISNETNLGNTKSFNKALKLATGKFIIDLATDDVLLPNCISDQIEKFKTSSFSNLGIVYGNAELIDENGKFISHYFEIDSNKKSIEKRKTGIIYESILAGGNSVCSVTSMVKKSVFEELNGYDENLAFEDLDFWIRASRNYQFDFIDAILMKRRVLENSLGGQFYKKSNKISYSTYIIYKKAFQLNRLKLEDKALLKRIHHDIILNFKNNNYWLVLKLIFLELKVRLRRF